VGVPAAAPTSTGPDRSSRRPTIGDVCLGAFVTIAVAVIITADIATGAPGNRPIGPVAYSFAIILGGLMVVRRRWPVGTLLGTLGLLALYSKMSYPPVGVAVPTAAAFYSAAERGRTRLAVGAAIAFLVFTTSIRVRQGDERLDILFGYELVTAVTLSGAVIALGDAVRSRRGWQDETTRRQELAEIEHEREAARRVAQERMQIAREVHDVLAHTVSVISIQADVAAEALDDDPAATRNAIRTIRASSSEALSELRSTLRLLRSSAAPRRPLGGIAQLDRIVGAAEESGLRVEVTVAGEPVTVPGVVDAAAHRIVQEAITNTLRHAGATIVQIDLCYGIEALVVTITDDGKGTTSATAGFGLTGMAERVEILGGSLRTGAAPDGGFRVEATLPLAVLA
jgi:signal transduction histidine kinase